MNLIHMTGLAMLFIASKGLAQGSGVAAGDYDVKDMAMLPPYCKYSPTFQALVPDEDVETVRAKVREWNGRLGPENFMHIHHYCKGLAHTNESKYVARTKVERDRSLQFAIREFDYVIPRVKPDFVLLPEILTHKAENLLRLDRPDEAMVQLKRAIMLKPDYWPTYAAVGDYYERQGDIPRAKEWLEMGLAAAPNTPALQRRLTQIDATSKQGKGSR